LCCRPVRYGYYILPTYPSDLATIQFDRAGTTHIGRYSGLRCGLFRRRRLASGHGAGADPMRPAPRGAGLRAGVSWRATISPASLRGPIHPQGRPP